MDKDQAWAKNKNSSKNSSKGNSGDSDPGARSEK